MDIHVKNYLKNFIPYGPYCHEFEDGVWCPFYKSTWNNTIKNYKRTRRECEWGDCCYEDCRQCDEIVSYCSFLDHLEYGNYPLGDGVKRCYEKYFNVLNEKGLNNLVKNDTILNFYTHDFQNIKNKGVRK